MIAFGRWLGARPAWLLPAALLALLLLGKLVDPLPLRQLQAVVFDTLQNLEPRVAPDDLPVRVVDVDDASLTRIGQWPWPRDLIATMIDRLREAGAAAVVLDTVFAEPDRTSPARALARFRGTSDVPADLPDHDRLLAEALRKIPAIGGFGFAERAATTPPKRITSPPGYSGPDPKPHLPHHVSAVTDLPEIEDALQGYGAFNGLPDADVDGVLRRAPLFFTAFDEIYPSLLAETLRVLAGDKGYRIKTAGGSGEGALGARTGMVAMRVGNGEAAITVPTDANGAVPIHFARLNLSRTISAWRLLGADAIDGLDGAVVILGASATGLGDVWLTPFGYMPGVQIQAQALDQVLSGAFLERPDWAAGLELVVLLVAGLLLVFTLPKLTPGPGALLAGAAIALCVGAAWLAFTNWRFLFDPVYPAICLAALYGATTLIGFMRAERERAFIRSAFSRYISKALVQQIAADPSKLKLGGERREMSFIFTDIAGFTTLSEAIGPAAVAKLLNPYFDELCRLILAEEGMVNEFIGDAVLAYFGAPVEQADHAARAIRCARALDAFAERFRAEQNAAGVALGATRIGVHSGTALLGNFGAQERFKYAALGDVVNTASRIEGLNKHFGTRVCASRAVLDLAGDPGYRMLGDVVVKGRTEAIGIGEVLPLEHAASEPVARYREGYAALAAGDAARAKAIFDALAAAAPGDPALVFQLARLAEGARDTRVLMTEK